MSRQVPRRAFPTPQPNEPKRPNPLAPSTTLTGDKHDARRTTLGQPFEVLKTHMAANRQDSLRTAISKTIGRGGFKGFYQGLIPWVSTLRHPFWHLDCPIQLAPGRRIRGERPGTRTRRPTLIPHLDSKTSLCLCSAAPTPSEPPSSRINEADVCEAIPPQAWIESSTAGAVLLFTSSYVEDFAVHHSGMSRGAAGLLGGAIGGAAQGYLAMCVMRTRPPLVPRAERELTQRTALDTGASARA